MERTGPTHSASNSSDKIIKIDTIKWTNDPNDEILDLDSPLSGLLIFPNKGSSSESTCWFF